MAGKFGRWKVLGRGEDYTYPSGKKAIRLRCECSCGVVKDVHKTHLKNGTSQSCGCLNREISSKHGKSHTREYKSWWHMISRCREEAKSRRNVRYEGIKVCPEWENSFETFLEDMGECPDGFELDRVDSYGDYTPANCRWVSEIDQANNRRMFSSNTSGKTGVTWSSPHNKWRVYLYHKKKKYEGGLFEDFEKAVERRRELELEVLGEYKYE